MSRLLEPEILLSIRNLPLAAKTTVDGFMTGINSSRIKGPGLEFSQYRSYQPGDDLRWLDWKMYARSDRYYIRESEIETSISIRFLLDASASMDHTDNNGISKIAYARYLTASLGYLARAQGDAVGLHVMQDGKVFSLPARNDHQHLNRFYYQLEQVKPSGVFTRDAGMDLLAGGGKRDLLICITDLYQQESEILTLLDALSAQRHEIILFHLAGRNELEFDYQGYGSLQDLETGETISISNTNDREAYLQRMQAHLDAMRTAMLKRNITYRLLTTDEPLQKALRDFLKQRKRNVS